MSTQIMQAVVLVCDGCKSEIGTTGEFRTAMEARAAGYGRGWRFPARIRANGVPSELANDVCPECVADWRPRGRESPARERRSQYRPISDPD